MIEYLLLGLDGLSLLVLILLFFKLRDVKKVYFFGLVGLFLVISIDFALRLGLEYGYDFLYLSYFNELVLVMVLALVFLVISLLNVDERELVVEEED